MKTVVATLLFAGYVMFAVGCQSGGEKASPESSSAQKQAAVPSALSSWETIHGIGPIKSELKLDPINKSLADKGEKVFEMKCTACHKMDERYVGPAVRGITVRRSPEFIMNMVLNPDEMVKKHPEVQKLLAEYLTPMTYQNVSEEDARAILEYLRIIDQESK